MLNQHSKQLIFVRLLFLVASLVPGTVAGAGNLKANSPQVQKLSRVIIQANIQANQKLFENMQVVARLLNNEVQTLRHIPQQGDEVDTFLKQTQQALPVNPFAADLPIQTSELVPPQLKDLPIESLAKEKSPTKVQLIFDRHFDPEKIDDYAEQPPDDWQAEPGTITIVTNGVNGAAVWGAGSNWRPIRGDDPQKIRLLLLSVHQ